MVVEMAMETIANNNSPSSAITAGTVCTTTKPLHILTIGDGDFSCSLALKRAYGHHIHVTASSLLPSAQEVQALYPHSAPKVLDELTAWTNQNEDGTDHSLTIVYGLDATQLHCHEATKGRQFDVILFHHPHLGYRRTIGRRTKKNDVDAAQDWNGKEGNESKNMKEEEDISNSDAESAERHCVLIAHYLASASQCLVGALSEDETAPVGCIHLCLCGTQEHTFKVQETAQRLGMTLTTSSVQKPMLGAIIPLSTLAKSSDTPSSSVWAAPRRHRRDHWLGKYGYQHQPTQKSTKLLNATGSRHYWFRPTRRSVLPPILLPPACEDACFNTCNVCGLFFGTKAELIDHMNAPALPYNYDDEEQDDFDIPSTTPDMDSYLPPPNESDSQHENKGEDRHLSNIRNNTNDLHGDGDKDSSGHCSRAAYCFPVDETNDGTRLRSFLLNVVKEPALSTKRRCCQFIRKGNVLINKSVVVDEARILRTGWIVEIVSEEENTSCLAHSVATANPQIYSSSVSTALTSGRGALPSMVEVVDQWSDMCHVFWKPVGMRASGSFDPHSLESWARQYYGSLHSNVEMTRAVSSYSKLDRGIGGLCVLGVIDPEYEQSHSMKATTLFHSFAALVHGLVPQDWKNGLCVNLPLHQIRRWKKRYKTGDDNDRSEGSNDLELEKEDCTVITLLEQTNKSEGVPELSTVLVRTSSNTSGIAGAVSYYLRKVGFGVVGDRFSMEEYLSLPRYMRNRLKQKVCLGCIRVEAQSTRLSGHVTMIPLPEKWSADYWQNQLVERKDV